MDTAAPAPEKYYLRAAEISVYTPLTPCPMSVALCVFGVTNPCDTYPDCPASSYTAPTVFGAVNITASAPDGVFTQVGACLLPA